MGLNIKRQSFIATFLIFLAPTLAGADTGLARTWEKAEIWVRTAEGFFSSHMDDAILLERLNGAGKKYPTVIFFHDCGKNRKQAGWHYARFMARAGFAVILPDSFARPDRPETCEYWQFKPLDDAPLGKVHALRKAEISHALMNAKKLKWVDTSNLFAMGHGEGGDALAAYTDSGYKARIISGALCKWGVGGSKDKPTLSLASREDRLFQGQAADTCANKTDGYPLQTILFDGFQHDTSSLPQARETVIDFLKTLVK
ncbi:MAG: hypothetical protein ISR45_03560 [Rhodospirillales bacterium]|nr:hypothetical protein [Rhodospirillales bacterium]